MWVHPHHHVVHCRSRVVSGKEFSTEGELEWAEGAAGRRLRPMLGLLGWMDDRPAKNAAFLLWSSVCIIKVVQRAINACSRQQRPC